LSATLGKWKSDSGRMVEAFLEPKDVVDTISTRINYSYYYLEP